MNKKQYDLLKRIYHDRYAIGPFKGMIFNVSEAKRNEGITMTDDAMKTLITRALNIDCIIQDMLGFDTEKLLQESIKGDCDTVEPVKGHDKQDENLKGYTKATNNNSSQNQENDGNKCKESKPILEPDIDI